MYGCGCTITHRRIIIRSCLFWLRILNLLGLKLIMLNQTHYDAISRTYYTQLDANKICSTNNCMKTKSKSHQQLFMKYSKSKIYLTKREISKLLSHTYHLRYSKCVINSLMAIWGTTMNGKQVISKQTFPKLYNSPEGFLRDYR